MADLRFLRVLGGIMLIAAIGGCGGGGSASSGGFGGSGGDGGNGGGGGGGVDPPPPPVSPFTAPTEAQALYFALDMPTEFNNVLANHNFGGATPLSSLTSLGQVSYDGFMEISIASTPNANVRSGTTLTLNMTSGGVTGNADEFMGMVLNSETGIHEMALYEGVVTFSGGSLTPFANGDTRLDMQIDGALDNGLQDFTLTGIIDGRLYGPEANGLFASGSYFGLGRDITLTADGVDVYGTATIWAVK